MAHRKSKPAWDMEKVRRANELADLAAAGWATAIRERVKALAVAVRDVLGEMPLGAEVSLEGRIEKGGCVRLVILLDDAEQTCDELLSGELLLRLDALPDVRGACRAASEALGARASEK